MNHLTANDAAWNWPTLTEEEFNALLDTFQGYRRSAWGDCIEYKEVPSGSVFAYEVNQRPDVTNQGRYTGPRKLEYLVHPDLVK